MSEIKCVFNGLSEHDMDMLFLQLFSIDTGFVRLFLNAASFNKDDFRVDSIELSKSDPQLGESDITVMLTIGKEKVAMLIEDKIDAIAMPEQAARYIERGDKGITQGEYDRYFSFIVCPQKYYDNNEEAHKYPNFLTYEAISKYLSKKKTQLYQTYSQQIDQAIDKAKRPSQMTLNEQANAFYCKYKDYQETNYPSLDLRTSRNANGYWAQYATRFGSNVNLLHKIQEGRVDLTFNNGSTKMNEMEIVTDWLRRHGITEARAQKTGKAAAIHIDVPKLDMSIPFENNNMHDIVKCFDVVEELLSAANVFASVGNLAEKK